MNGTPLLAPDRRIRPTLLLILARVVYAFNWYNVGAVLPLIGAGLAAGPEALGLVLGAFLLGVGIFQVPAGIAAVRWGARTVSLVGLAILGAAGLVSGFAPTWTILAIVRFVAGVGAAFFFSPALSLVASYYPEGHRGPIIGLYNGGFSIGGAVGLLGGALIGSRWGWGAALYIGGAAMLVTAVACAVVLPDDRMRVPRPAAAEVWRSVRAVLGSRSIWALSLGLTGFWGAIYIVAQYFVDYGQVVHPSWTIGLAAALATVVIIVSFPAGPIGGWLGERPGDRRVLLVGFAAAAGVLVLLVPYLSLPLLTLDFVALGLLDGMIFAVLYLIPTYLPETSGQGLALGVAVVNSIQVGLGSGLAVTFGFIVASFGYTPAWVMAGAGTLCFLPLLYWVRVPSVSSSASGSEG